MLFKFKNENENLFIITKTDLLQTKENMGLNESTATSSSKQKHTRGNF